LEIKALVESLLFVADRPVTVDDLAAALKVEADDIESALQVLHAEYQERGIRLQRQGARLQLVSAPEAGPQVERLLGLEILGQLSPPALEALAIVAYRQPVTRSQIEAIRGVHSGGVLRTLVRRGLLEEIGRGETVGRPILYGVSFDFLQQFGLTSVQDLPQWEDLGKELAQRQAQEPGAEDEHSESMEG
jgi:segregation and condensation protein B